MKKFFIRMWICSGLIFSSLNLIQAQPVIVRLLSYNIYHGENPYQKGQSNLREIAALINDLNPDVVLLQEVDSLTGRSAKLNQGEKLNIADALATMTGMYGHFGKAIDYDNGGYGEGILTKFPFESRTMALPNPKGGEARAVIMIEGDLPGGRRMVIAGTHLCHEFEENRMAQLKAMDKYFKKLKLPVVLAGDFNFEEDTETYRWLGKSWLDVAAEFGEAKATYPAHNPEKRIDYFFVNKKNQWCVREVKTFQLQYSDHLPILVTLELVK
ncbi:MAG: endonuclease/exonuclease/phosphatase family protein [Cyclobacteriaceae bacterium]|nr:endonuclease/exonuclease/phosphatase family protein [Cyclobacteriaceae bacterium]